MRNMGVSDPNSSNNLLALRIIYPMNIAILGVLPHSETIPDTDGENTLGDHAPTLVS